MKKSERESTDHTRCLAEHVPRSSAMQLILINAATGVATKTMPSTSSRTVPPTFPLIPSKKMVCLYCCGGVRYEQNRKTLKLTIEHENLAWGDRFRVYVEHE